ncbi:MAG: lysophospholipid acyltransferase family protein [Planctomycetes bacterium]|nr:lysophospholipid acyltransferase family protein [Planctomycetota bacterium]
MNQSKHGALRYAFEYLFFYYTIITVKLLGFNLSQQISYPLGFIPYLLLPRLKRKAIKNFLLSGVATTNKEARKLTLKMFQHLIMSLFEVFFLYNVRRRTLKYVRFINAEILLDINKKKTGAVCIFSHHGNWELGLSLALLGLPMQPIIRPPESSVLYDIITKMRLSKGSVPLEKFRVADEMVRRIKEKKFITIDMDQNAGSEGVRVKFFQKDVSCWKTPAILSLRYQVPVIPVKVVRRNQINFIIIGNPIYPSEAAESDDKIKHLTQIYVSKIEEHMKNEPYQWLWFLNRWKIKKKTKKVLPTASASSY